MSEGSEVLKQIRARIKSPGHFIRRGDGIGHCAQDGSGRWVTPLDPLAVAFTIRGAFFVQETLLHKAGNGAPQGSQQGALGDEAAKPLDGDRAYGLAEEASLRAVNQNSRYDWKKAGDYMCALDHAEVLELLDRAIALEEEIAK
jgi:hypothetical protein